jgi:alkylation response protein AidB-like acyl-CoA dehydrogenase
MTMTPQEIASFGATARDWLAANVPARWVDERGALSDAEATEIRMEWDRRLYAGGYAGLSIPTEYGGQGLGLEAEVVFGELAARAHAPDGFGRIGKILTGPTLIARGTPEQQARYLDPLLSGNEIWCQAFSEPGAGSDLAAVSTFARRSERGGYLVSGQKVWTSFASRAHKALLLAKTSDEAPRYRNLSMFLLDMKQPGITIRPLRQISGASHFAEVFLDNAFVSLEDRLGDEGDGWNMAMTVFQSERGGVESISRYVEIRADVDLLLSCCAKHGNQLDAASEFDIRLELVRWQVIKALSRQDDETAFSAATGVLKLFWSELWQEVTRMGIDSMCPAHRDHWRFQYLEIRSATIYAGSSEIQRNIIGDRILGLPR